MLILQEDTMEKLCSHAQMEYPKECCGIMLGKRQDEQRITYKVIPTKNIIDESKNTTHFLINPLEILEAELLAQKEKLEIVGFYHSHPDYEAIASEEDMLYMMEGYSYSIISVKNGTSVRISSFEKVSQADTDAKEEDILVKEK